MNKDAKHKNLFFILSIICLIVAFFFISSITSLLAIVFSMFTISKHSDRNYSPKKKSISYLIILLGIFNLFAMLIQFNIFNEYLSDFDSHIALFIIFGGFFLFLIYPKLGNLYMPIFCHYMMLGIHTIPSFKFITFISGPLSYYWFFESIIEAWNNSIYYFLIPLLFV